MPLDEDIDEALKRVLDEGSASAQPAELADLRAQLAGQQQDMTQGMGTELPKGTKVVFADFQPEEPQVSAPPPSRVAMAPKVVDVPGTADEDMELAYSRAQDNEARQRMAMERGGRELVAGLTRTQAQPVTQRPVDAVMQLYARRKDADAQRHQQNMERAAAGKTDFDTKEAARKAALEAQQRKEDLDEREKDNARADRSIDASVDNAEATRELARSNYGIKKEEHDAKKQERDEKASASAVPFLGGTLSLTPGLSDTERSQARTAAGMWNAADDAVANFQKTLEEFARAPSIESKGRVSAALRTASSAFNSAIGGGAMSADEARAMSEALGADLLTPSGLQALTETVFGDNGKAAATISNRVRAARQANRAAALGRLKTYGSFTDGQTLAQAGTAGGPQRKTLKDGRVVEKHSDGLWYPVGG